jgi:hypothetical protein
MKTTPLFASLESTSAISAAQLLTLVMIAHTFTRTAVAALPRLQQIRCHLVCTGRQLSHGHLDRLPFHLRGIVRAVLGA